VSDVKYYTVRVVCDVGARGN